MVALPGDADGRGDGEEDQGPGQEHQEDEEAGRQPVVDVALSECVRKAICVLFFDVIEIKHLS